MLRALLLMATLAQAFQYMDEKPKPQDINNLDYTEESDVATKKVEQKIEPTLGVKTRPCQEYYGTIPYKRIALLNVKGLPTNLAVDPKTKDLHFTLIDEDSFDNDTQTKMDQYVFKGGKVIKLDNIHGQAAAFDPVTKKMYIGTEDGLKRVDNDLKIESESFPNQDIVHLFKPKKPYLYAIVYPINEVFKLDVENNNKIKIPNVPCSDVLAVDDDENVYFSDQHKKIPHVLLKGFQEPIEFVGIPENAVKAMAVDSKGRVVIASNDGLYQLNAQSVIPKKLMNLDFVPSGLVIDQYDIYVASRNVIYRYRPFVCSSN